MYQIANLAAAEGTQRPGMIMRLIRAIISGGPFAIILGAILAIALLVSLAQIFGTAGYSLYRMLNPKTRVAYTRTYQAKGVVRQCSIHGGYELHTNMGTIRVPYRYRTEIEIKWSDDSVKLRLAFDNQHAYNRLSPGMAVTCQVRESLNKYDELINAEIVELTW